LVTPPPSVAPPPPRGPPLPGTPKLRARPPARDPSRRPPNVIKIPKPSPRWAPPTPVPAAQHRPPVFTSKAVGFEWPGGRGQPGGAGMAPFFAPAGPFSVIAG